MEEVQCKIEFSKYFKIQSKCSFCTHYKTPFLINPKADTILFANSHLIYGFDFVDLTIFHGVAHPPGRRFSSDSYQRF
jgi:hypothetical protein